MRVRVAVDKDLGHGFAPESSFTVTGEHEWTLEEAIERCKSGAARGIRYALSVRFDPDPVNPDPEMNRAVPRFGRGGGR